jgi:hypothetical protein
MYFRKDVELSSTISFFLYSRQKLWRNKLMSSVETNLHGIPVDQQGAFSLFLRMSIIYISALWLEIPLGLGDPTAQPDFSLIITYNRKLSSAAAEVVLPASDTMGGSVILDGVLRAVPFASAVAPVIVALKPVKKMLDGLASVGDHVHSFVVNT